MIKTQLGLNEIDRAIEQINAYHEKMIEKGRDLCRRLAEIGLQVASVKFSGAQYDGKNDASVTVEPTKNGYMLVASGKSVCFIEFGAGVHYNSNSTYPLPKPIGISDIGQYGEGNGAQDHWIYPGESGGSGKHLEGGNASDGYVLSYGTPAQMPMYLALVEMQKQVQQIASEVFGHD